MRAVDDVKVEIPDAIWEAVKKHFNVENPETQIVEILEEYIAKQRCCICGARIEEPIRRPS
ncbi:hypothetical protein Q2941_37565 [Bradyrhizobium sp. UFLA05-153]